jgi:hypothetical protein
MIVKVYGEFWSRERVDWSARKLLGIRRKTGLCDIWNQRGVYALHKDFAIVYIGQADTRGIGPRLCEHRLDRLAERWDSFSFFGICEVDKHGNAKPGRPVRVPPSSVIRSLELIGILLSDPPLNRARGRFPESQRVHQQPTEAAKGSRYEMGKKLSELASQVAELQNMWGTPRRSASKHKLPQSSTSNIEARSLYSSATHDPRSTPRDISSVDPPRIHAKSTREHHERLEQGVSTAGPSRAP